MRLNLIMKVTKTLKVVRGRDRTCNKQSVHVVADNLLFVAESPLKNGYSLTVIGGGEG